MKERSFLDHKKDPKFSQKKIKKEREKERERKRERERERERERSCPGLGFPSVFSDLGRRLLLLLAATALIAKVERDKERDEWRTVMKRERSKQ